jgi:hypothetical protein
VSTEGDFTDLEMRALADHFGVDSVGVASP